MLELITATQAYSVTPLKIAVLAIQMHQGQLGILIALD
jgi:hypothetical protein